VTKVDTVTQWEASQALKGAVDALLADMLRSLVTTGRPEVVLMFGERLQRLMAESGLPIGVATKAAFGGKSVDDFLGALDAGGFPPGGVAELRAALGKSAKRASPPATDPAAALALVPAIPLPEHFEDPAAALVLVPAIALPEHSHDAGEQPATVEAAARAPEASAHTEQTEEAAGVAAAHARASEGSPRVAVDEKATMRNVAKAAAAGGITLAPDDLRIAARIVDHLRLHADRLTHRAAHLRGSIHRRPRASRAPRRAARRSAVAPARDGPPPPSDGPTPVASRSLRGAVGGSR
jgi:hypothetical protein